MPIYAVGNKVPRIHPTAFIAPTASVVGDVVVHQNASIWYGAVVRGDTSYAVIGPGANVQDGAIVHSRAGNPALIGAEAGIAHGAIVHGATIGDRALIANGAIVLDGATVEAGALVAAGSVVPPGMVVPAGMLAIGSPAEVKRALAGTPTEEHVINNPIRYANLRDEHVAGMRELSRDETLIP
jgi:carbonic anhydrase/acetyltransferase-like protein (isoleucine patch superfamily)